MTKPKILLHIGTYLPGYRGGGPTQSVKNLVEALSGEYEFYILTTNHDLGISEPYAGVVTDRWDKYNGVNIFYSSDKNKRKNIKKVLKDNAFSLIFLNSFFNTDTIRILVYRKLLHLNTPTVLMPRGELSEGALNIKRIKKLIYISLAKKIKLLNGIHYLTTALDEYEQVQKVLETNKINKVANIPNLEKKITLNTKEEKKLKVVFLSRITQKKNLDYALKTLKHSKGNIHFDIYGTIEEKRYWEKCEEIIKTLPKNIMVNYKGELPNEKVITLLSQYDLLYFPTKSENYGHVISEALQGSIPVLISDQTPWRNLESKKRGWDYSLENGYEFSKKIDELSTYSPQQFNDIKNRIYAEYNPEHELNKSMRNYHHILRDIIHNFPNN